MVRQQQDWVWEGGGRQDANSKWQRTRGAERLCSICGGRRIAVGMPTGGLLGILPHCDGESSASPTDVECQRNLSGSAVNRCSRDPRVVLPSTSTVNRMTLMTAAALNVAELVDTSEAIRRRDVAFNNPDDKFVRHSKLILSSLF